MTGFTPQKRTGTAESRNNQHAHYWNQQPQSHVNHFPEKHNDKVVPHNDMENQDHRNPMAAIKLHKQSYLKRAKSASATKRNLRVSRLGAMPKKATQSKDSKFKKARGRKGFRPVTAGPTLERSHQVFRNGLLQSLMNNTNPMFCCEVL